MKKRGEILVHLGIFIVPPQTAFLSYCYDGLSWDRSKINKQECCLTRKGHGNGVIVKADRMRV